MTPCQPSVRRGVRESDRTLSRLGLVLHSRQILQDRRRHFESIEVGGSYGQYDPFKTPGRPEYGRENNYRFSTESLFSHFGVRCGGINRLTLGTSRANIHLSIGTWKVTRYEVMLVPFEPLVSAGALRFEWFALMEHSF